MGKKQKKLARQHRLKESRKPKPAKKSGKGEKSKLQPLRFQPIVFVRGDDYEPVKYAMAESRDIQIDLDLDEVSGLESEVGEVGPEEMELDVEEMELGEPELEEMEVPELEEMEVPELEDMGLEEPELEESSSSQPDSSRDASVLLQPDTAPHTAETLENSQLNQSSQRFSEPLNSLSSEFDSDVSILDFEIEPNQALPSDFSDISSDELQYSDSDSGSDLPSDFQFSDDPYHSAFGAYEVADDNDDEEDEPTMEAEIDYNDMDLDDLVKLGINIDDDYDDEYGMYANSDADDVITGLLAGNSLNNFARPSKKPRNNKQKGELSKRRRDRLEAREQARAISFGKVPPLWQQYPDQLTVKDVVKELQTLIYTPNLQEVRFPPLDHNANWYVGEIAKLHGLKVKSYTAAKHSCLMALKTSRASIPEQGDRAKLGTLMHRRQTFRRMDTKVPQSAATNIKTKSSRPKEGQIVGHNAEAVSAGIGHKLMQAMGWSAGTGLGVQRDGIQVPLEARIKLTKSGLQEKRVGRDI